MVLGIQIVGILFGAFLMYFTFLNYKRKEFVLSEFVFWSLLWLIFTYIVIFPYTLSFIADSLNIARMMDFFTIGGFMFLIALTFYNYLINMHLRKKLEHVVRTIAIRKKK